MFFHILDEPRQLLLKKLAAAVPVKDSYLAGGTALALLFGHRESIDFDWFTPVSFDPGELATRLAEIGEVRIAETKQGTFHGWVDGIQVTWLRYPNPLLEDLITSEQIPDVKLASVLDISLMKWAAISDRGSRKDFIDMFAICEAGITLREIYSLLSKKFPKANINYYHMVKSLSYFDDAEAEMPPVMLKKYDWEEIKSFFIKEQRDLMEDMI